jgi:hypothetical protein
VIEEARQRQRLHRRVVAAAAFAAAAGITLALALALALGDGARAPSPGYLVPPPIHRQVQVQATTSLAVVRYGVDAAKVLVISDQAHAVRYTVEVSVSGSPARRFGPIALRPGGTWSRIVRPVSSVAAVRALLYADARPSVPYRWVTLRSRVGSPRAS